ncbi:MAG: polysaccharide deacetylase family protein, partial [Bacteroidota bacterium]
QKKFKKNILNIAITFDGGYANNYKYAVPILEKYNVPASFFITTIHEKAPCIWTDYVDIVSYHTEKTEIILERNLYHKNAQHEFSWNGISMKNVAKALPYDVLQMVYTIFAEDWEALPPKKYEDYWMLMNVPQIQEIAAHPLCTIGAHSELHRSLVDIPLEDAKQEIANSKTQLEAICKQPITAFSFPFGYYNQELITYCKDIGFDKLLCTTYDTNEDAQQSTLQERFEINPYLSVPQQLAYLLKGTYY